MIDDFVFTSESVTEGHPDKLCDQISDAIVDQFVSQDPHAMVRAECAVSSAILFIAARFRTRAKVDLPHVARRVIKRVGYDQEDFNAKTCSILTAPQGFPPDEYAQFNERELSEEEIGRIRVKDQVTIFGFACDQTPVLMPYPIWIANRLSRRLDEVRHSGILAFILPDGKVQVGVEYQKRRPSRIHSISIMISQKSTVNYGQKTLYDDIMESVIKPVFATEQIRPDEKTRVFVNPDGPFTGGPSHHSGLTGRKSGVDTYGEYCRHSGNALSGKDPSRIDRVGAYIARYAAKNVVAAGLARKCEIALSYSIGFAHPVSLQVESFGTGVFDDARLTDLVKKHFDFRIAGILRKFDLRNLPAKNPHGYYQKLATYGHFGRDDLNPPWEATDKIDELASAK